jgi:hypothetical protein
VTATQITSNPFGSLPVGTDIGCCVIEWGDEYKIVFTYVGKYGETPDRTHTLYVPKDKYAELKDRLFTTGFYLSKYSSPGMEVWMRNGD